MKRDSFKRALAFEREVRAQAAKAAPRMRSKDYAEHRRLSHCLLNIRVSVEENGLTRGGVVSVFAFKEKSRMLAEQCGWSLTSVTSVTSAKGHVDGETFRKRCEEPPLHTLVGIDDCSEGFRADYLHRPLSEYALSADPQHGVFEVEVFLR